jgi:hypothetical protein
VTVMTPYRFTVLNTYHMQACEGTCIPSIEKYNPLKYLCHSRSNAMGQGELALVANVNVVSSNLITRFFRYAFAEPRTCPRPLMPEAGPF